MIIPHQKFKDLYLIEPYVNRSSAFGMSFGAGPASYDIRIAEDIVLWPGRFVLASAIEHFAMPDDIMGVVHDKSTWARRGLSAFNTIIDPGFNGFLTLELKLKSFRFIRLRRGMPIAQVVFHRLEEDTIAPYRGKYQHQEWGPQGPRLV